MALRGTFNFFGVDKTNAFAKITTINGGKSGWSAQIGVWLQEPTGGLETAPGSNAPVGTVSVSAAYVEGKDALETVYEAAALLPVFTLMASDVVKSRITRLEFYQRFTQAEQVTIRTAAKSSVAIENYLAMVDMATYIDLARADTIAGVTALQTGGLINSGRAAVILTP